MSGNQTHGYVGTRTGNPAGSFGPGGQLLNNVKQAPTLERGLATMRTGIADILAQQIGGAVSQQGVGFEDGGGGGGGGGQQAITLSEEQVNALNQLYVSLTTDDEAWAEALIANTPMAAAVDKADTQTASRSAMA